MRTEEVRNSIGKEFCHKNKEGTKRNMRHRNSLLGLGEVLPGGMEGGFSAKGVCNEVDGDGDLGGRVWDLDEEIGGGIRSQMSGWIGVGILVLGGWK
jgi:hypothetical protein